MQTFWKYLDDLIGKGLETNLILELIFYASANLVPITLPLSVLLSSMIVIGNLSEIFREGMVFLVFHFFLCVYE